MLCRKDCILSAASQAAADAYSAAAAFFELNSGYYKNQFYKKSINR